MAAQNAYLDIGAAETFSLEAIVKEGIFYRSICSEGPATRADFFVLSQDQDLASSPKLRNYVTTMQLTFLLVAALASGALAAPAKVGHTDTFQAWPPSKAESEVAERNAVGLPAKVGHTDTFQAWPPEDE